MQGPLRNKYAHVRKTHRFYPADHTQRPAEKNCHAHYFLRGSCDFRFAVSSQGPCTKNVCYLCVLLACHRFKMVGKSDLQTIIGQVLVPYFPLASQFMIPKHVRAKCVKCTTAVLEAHLVRTTCTVSLTHDQTSNFQTVGERPTSWLHEPLAPQVRIPSKQHRNITFSRGGLQPINLPSPCVQKQAQRDVRLALHTYNQHFNSCTNTRTFLFNQPFNSCTNTHTIDLSIHALTHIQSTFKFLHYHTYNRHFNSYTNTPIIDLSIPALTVTHIQLDWGLS